MGALGLTAKYKRALEKGNLKAIRLVFTPEGVKVEGSNALDEDEDPVWIPLPEAMASPSRGEERPFLDEKAHTVGRYEVRLDEEAPQELRNATSKVVLDAAVAALPFRKRRALQMSNREFELAFLRWEGGNPVPRPAEQAEALRAERAATRGGNRGRGRGRGGRGRGSFRGAQAPQNPPQAGGA